MRIIYVARHGIHDNCDESSIGWSLEQLGHTVARIEEKHAYSYLHQSQVTTGADLLLFHKWPDAPSYLPDFKRRTGIPACFWYFDLVGSDDPLIKERSHLRIEWMQKVIPHCLMGFCTDGDWVHKWNEEHPLSLFWLMQGCDERIAGPGKPRDVITDILFMGMVRHGQKRADHIANLRSLYGDRLTVIGDGGPLRRVHGRSLADLVASSKIVLAPIGPSTDHYWSNRVYLTCGFQGFMLHPFCSGLTEHYASHNILTRQALSVGEGDIATYTTEDECISSIEFCLKNPYARCRAAISGYQRTIREHTYRHRCARLIETVEDRLSGRI